MRRRGETNTLKRWLSGFLIPKAEVHYMPDGPIRHTGPGGFISRAQNFTLNNPTMTSIQGNQYTTYVQGDGNITPQIMKLLSDHIILGAAHDDSARVPPPRCHPGTRINLIARITTWFKNEDPNELLLWITGPAGVGKSAVVQTFAEYLVESNLLGASVFCSRPNKRNNPYRVFITIAYQLAIRIPAYREFVVERLSLDPQLLNRNMATQFRTFIIEPFVGKNIGAGGRRWGILLDGLDELEGEDAQCEIIQLISAFAHNHRDAPLLWIIASRPESHISNTFEDDEVRRSCWIEDIPIDSTEAHEDVERFLRYSFKTIQKKFRQSTPSDWPSNTDFLKLTAAASGLFVYAEVVMRFIKDSYHADPVSQFKILLAVIDRCTTVPTQDNPFVHLDALYHEILSSIPPAFQPVLKQLLGFTIHGEQIQAIYPYTLGRFQTLRGMSILFNLNRHTIYACLNKCRSILKIPDWKVSDKEKLTFLHASFSDYLDDPGRSGNFHVGNLESVQDVVVLNLIEIWKKCSGAKVATASVESVWQQYCSKVDNKTPSRAVAKFHAQLFHDVVYCLGPVAYHIAERPAESLAYVQLRSVHMAKLCYHFHPEDLFDFVFNVKAQKTTREFTDSGLCRETHLKDLHFEHLDWKDMSPAYARIGRRGRLSKDIGWILHRPDSNVTLTAFVSELENLQQQSPELKVTIFGGLPEGRVAAFHRPEDGESQDVYYVIPCPE